MCFLYSPPTSGLKIMFTKFTGVVRRPEFELFKYSEEVTIMFSLLAAIYIANVRVTYF